MAKKPEFKEFADAVFECMKRHSIPLEDLYVYPVSGGYKAEVYGVLNGSVLDSIRECISKSTGFEVVLARVERGYLKILAKRVKAN